MIFLIAIITHLVDLPTFVNRLKGTDFAVFSALALANGKRLFYKNRHILGFKFEDGKLVGFNAVGF